MNDYLRSMSERIIDPPLFDVGDEVMPWQDTFEIRKGQLCIVTRVLDYLQVEVATTDSKGQIFVVTTPLWLMETFRELAK